MINQRYSDYIEISPTFESVVDIDADTRNQNLWREYIVGEDMEKMMEKLCQSLNKEEPDSRRSFWIEGTYGTGKSYAAIVIKHLMEEKPEVVDAFLSKNSRLSAYRNRFMKCRAKEKGDYIVIWKTGCTGIRDGNAMLIEAEKAVREALAAKFGDKADYGEKSLHDAVKKQINNPVLNWESILENTDLGDDYGSVEELREDIEAGDVVALQRTAAVIRQFNWGLVDSLDTFKKWITAVINNNGLAKSGIFFIWDEFTEYVANSDDQTILQQLSEFCKVEPFFMLFVVHRTSDMINRITPERYQLITHRFHQVEFHISMDAAFDLIEGSINIRNGMNEHWKEARRDVIKNIKPFLPDIVGLDDKISEHIEHMCPMHPMTIKLLSRVAENYAASQRTMFRFMKDQSTNDQGFVGYINTYGPDSQACWLTPDWLWDYFFTRESDFSDKDTKVADYIRHYEESVHLVQNDENAMRVFKTAMLLLALMSSTKGIYSGRRTRDGIAATEECLEICLSGVMNKMHVKDLLETMSDSKILMLDSDAKGNVRIQLPFRGTGDMDFPIKLEANNKKHSRYKMFSKDGVFAQELEKQAWDSNDVTQNRMKIAACCAETSSINTRLEEVTKELDKFPYKLGLLIVTVHNDTQAVFIQSVLQEKAANSGESRLIIALLKTPLTDDKRKQWLTAITKQEMASEAGQTASVNQYKTEAQVLINSWVSSAVSGGKIIAYCGEKQFNNIYGMAHLRKIIRISVQDEIFKYAPENLVVTNTAYRSCNDKASLAGIQRKGSNSQLNNVLNSLKSIGVLDMNTIDEVAMVNGNKSSDCIAALANLIRKQMKSGQKVNLGDLWSELQCPPYGYYNSIACGVLLGFVFSFYKNTKYSWTDSIQASHNLSETTMSKMVTTMCTGKMTTDYLSAGSITWQRFSEYLSKIFGLTEAQLAVQTNGYHSVREAVIKSGAPFWTLKYLPDDVWPNEDLKNTSQKVIDNIQVFITQSGDSDIEGAMSNVLQLLQGRGKIRVILAKSFQNKNILAKAFRGFLFNVSPELEEIASRLAVHPEELSDKLHSVMQGAIYTWTEEQVAEKLNAVVKEYQYLESIGNVIGTVYHSVQAARKDLSNLFKHLRIPMVAIEQLNRPWYPALEILYNIGCPHVAHTSVGTKEEEIKLLEQYGVFAKDCLSDGKPILEDILNVKGITYTDEELSAVYMGLKDLTCSSTLTQFEKELDAQIHKISFARNKMILQETWETVSGTKSIKDWCNHYGVPLMWIAPKDYRKAFSTLLDVQRRSYVVESSVIDAINVLREKDTSMLTDPKKIDNAFILLIGQEYKTMWIENRANIINTVKLRIGNDMSNWSTADLTELQRVIKAMCQEQAKKEKLAGTKAAVKTMQDSILRERVVAFLDMHPEFCDEFIR